MRCLSIILCAAAFQVHAAEVGQGAVHAVAELVFQGPNQGPRDTPARDVEFSVLFRHTDSGAEHLVHGYWDGDGQGGARGNVFTVRFCPTAPGRWVLAEVRSNHDALRGQREDDHVTATPGTHPGFWEVDEDSAGRRWFKRSDGSHPYIFGNTHYSFVSEWTPDGPNGSDIASDVRGNAKYFNKLRFSITGDRYVHPTEKPFFDDEGKPTDNGDFGHRPNPAWFHQRVDLAVKTAYELDLIADMILAGPDTVESRATLRAKDNGGDATPFLRYMAARYGSFPNVWFCTCNEHDIKVPKYEPEAAVAVGQILQSLLPYPTPLSIHRSQRDWPEALNSTPPWHTHVIAQRKRKTIPEAADVMGANHAAGGGCPVVNDELSYQGAGDNHTELDNIEAHLGAFLGGGYASGSYKPGNKLGQYFWGNFDVGEHSAAGNLRFLRGVIDAEMRFWKLAPVALEDSIFSNLQQDFRVLAWEGGEYALGTNAARKGMLAKLPPGTWRVVRHDIVAMESTQLSADASGEFAFDAPDARAVLYHFKRMDLPTSPR